MTISLNLAEFDKIFDDYIQEAEGKAENSFKRQKWILFGYWKAIAVHLRRLKRKIRTDLVSKSVGFPTRHERERLKA